MLRTLSSRLQKLGSEQYSRGQHRQQHLPRKCTFYFSPFGGYGGHLEIALILPVSYHRFLFPAAPNLSVLSSGLMSCRQTRTLIHSAAGPDLKKKSLLPPRMKDSSRGLEKLNYYPSLTKMMVNLFLVQGEHMLTTGCAL